MFSSAPDQAHQDRMDFKGETVLEHVAFWYDLADWQVKTRDPPSPSGIWQDLDEDDLPLPHTG